MVEKLFLKRHAFAKWTSKAFVFFYAVCLCTAFTSTVRADEKYSENEARISGSSPSENREGERDNVATLIKKATQLIGVPYFFGGTSDNGLDCSAFVQRVYEGVFGISLPRTALSMSKTGTPVKREDLKIGDLIFFNTLQRPFSHVGIYLGEGRIIHASSVDKQVVIDSLSSWFVAHINGIRRVVAL